MNPPPSNLRHAQPRRPLVPCQYPPIRGIIHPVPRTEAIVAGWTMLVMGFIAACLPFVGFFMLFFSIPLCVMSAVCGGVGVARGRVCAGWWLIVASVLGLVILFALPLAGWVIAITRD